VHLVKIDKSFVERVSRDTADAVLVRVVVEAAHSLGRRVCAEGVETIDQARQLIALGCDSAQGWLFGRPQPPSRRLAAALGDRAPSLDLSDDDAALPLGNSDELVMVTDPDMVITYASATVTNLLGWLPEDLIGLPVRSLLHPDDEPEVQQPGVPLDGPGSLVRRVRHRDGGSRWLAVTTRWLADHDDELREILLVGRDVTGTVEAQRALAASEAMIRHAFEYAPIGMAISSLDGTLLSVNTEYARLLGATPDQLQGRQVADITHPDDRVADDGNVAELVTGEAVAHDLVKRYLRVDGSTLWARVVASVIHDEGGTPTHVFAHILPMDPPAA
jgi:PAS domain S-box-containing protein